MARRKLGNLYQRKDSPVWWIWYYAVNGQRKHESTYTDSKTQASDILKQRITEALQIREGIKQESDIPLSVFMDKYITYIRTRKGYNTLRSYRSITKEFAEWANKREISRLREITKSLLEEFITCLRETGNKAWTCNNKLIVLKAMLYWGMGEKYISSNPAKGIEKLETSDRKPIRVFNQEEYQGFFKICHKHCKYYYPFFYTEFHTGLRLGEVFNLKWADIDWDNKFIRVTKPKGERGVQLIPMHDSLINVFKSIPKVNEYVFVDKENKSWHGFKTPQRYRDKTIQGVYKGILSQMGISARIHDIRHTFCSHLVNTGVGAYAVRDLMRHTDVETTQKYVHLFNTNLHKSISKLQQLDK